MLERTFAVHDLGSFGKAFGNDVAPIEGRSLRDLWDAHAHTHAFFEFLSEIVFRARLYRWAAAQLEGEQHNALRERLHDRLCMLGEEARDLYARQMRALDIPTPWEDVVLAAMRHPA